MLAGVSKYPTSLLECMEFRLVDLSENLEEPDLFRIQAMILVVNVLAISHKESEKQDEVIYQTNAVPRSTRNTNGGTEN